MNSKLFAIFCITVLFVTPLAQGTPRVMDDRIELDIYTNSGNEVRILTALYIQDALRPLGFDLNVHIVPLGQFVGKLLHQDSSSNFDLSIIEFAGGSYHPTFNWQYHSTDSFGRLMYQLDDANWQDFQKENTGYTTAQIDSMIDDIDNEFSIRDRILKTKNFDQFFYENLLYDYPLSNEIEKLSTWTGLSNGSHEFNSNFSLVESRKFGYYWQNNPTERSESLYGTPNGLQLRVAYPGAQNNFDKYQQYDSSSKKQSELLNEPLMNFDHLGNAHPGLAYQWIVDDAVFDHDSDPSTPEKLVKNGRHTFVLNTDMRFSATTDEYGNSIPSHQVDAHDIALTLDYLQHPDSQMSSKELFNNIVNYEISTTISPSDTISFFMEEANYDLNSYSTLGSLIALPDHILGNEIDLVGPNPQYSGSWEHYSSQEGFTAVGPMEISEFNIDGGYWKMDARSDYLYPNEWDIQEQYDSNSADFDTLANSLDQSNWGTADISTWAPHLGQINDEAYYWSYADDSASSTFERPTNQSITEVVYKIIEDSSAALADFETGGLDSIGISQFDPSVVDDHEQNANIVVQKKIGDTGPLLLVFNLLHEDLRQYNVRKAIAMALDKTRLANIPGTLRHSSDSIIWDRYLQYSTDGANTIEYDFQGAMNLVESLGYSTYPELLGPDFEFSSTVIPQDAAEQDYNLDDTLSQETLDGIEDVQNESGLENQPSMNNLAVLLGGLVFLVGIIAIPTILKSS